MPRRLQRKPKAHRPPRPTGRRTLIPGCAAAEQGVSRTIYSFLTRKWDRELEYRLIKELWAFNGDRIAVDDHPGLSDLGL
ncbi:MAG: DUF1348 family protein [Streptomyces sp.]|nr:DUF1348 family protein [Streptomyces sp.]